MKQSKCENRKGIFAVQPSQIKSYEKHLWRSERLVSLRETVMADKQERKGNQTLNHRN